MKILTPWEVKGIIDYDKLLKEFGLSLIDDELKKKLKRKAGELHPLIENNIFFAHRDLDEALKEGFYLYTGIAPSHGMHISHLVPFILTRWFQRKFRCNAYIMIPDEEKYLAKKAELSEIDKLKGEVAGFVSALGWNKHRTFLFFTRDYIYHLYQKAVEIARHINFSVARAVFGFSGETSIGLIFWPAIQIVPCFFERKRCLIPCGVDQDPYWRIQRDIAEKLGGKKTALIENRMFPSLLGWESKMSSSIPSSAIFLRDDEKTVEKKVKGAFTGGGITLEEHKKKGGRPEVCTVFFYLSVFKDAKFMRKLRESCRSGEIFCKDCKRMLAEVINSTLAELRENFGKDLDYLMYRGRLARRMWEWR